MPQRPIPGPAAAGGAGPVVPGGPGPAPGNGRADDVYSFLSSFTAGVQRGLDEAEQAAADRRER